MKTSVAIIAASIASASAFAPSSGGRASTQLQEKKKSFFSTVFEMDLFAPKSDQNDYGARSKKDLSVGNLGSKSYVPNGLSREQYAKVRAGEKAKKDANYKKNVDKAGKFLDYTQFYLDRGTDVGEKWSKSVTKGHRMAKTKFDWSGKTDQNKKQENTFKK